MTSVALRKPRKLELQIRSKIIRLLPDCQVCGKRMDPKFLKEWNGQERACKPCINEHSGEVPEHVYSN